MESSVEEIEKEKDHGKKLMAQLQEAKRENGDLKFMLN